MAEQKSNYSRHPYIGAGNTTKSKISLKHPVQNNTIEVENTLPDFLKPPIKTKSS